MCYHIATPSKKKLTLQFPEQIIYFQGFENYHISGFERPYVPVTLNNNMDTISTARWKLIPYWINNETKAQQYANTLNAESESIFEKPTYKNYIEQNRGLLYVTGFFEPHKVVGLKHTDNYFIYMENKEIFTLGIVYSIFDNVDTGESYPTFSIITTAANPQLEEIHNTRKRMPLIIAPEHRKKWLSDNNKIDINLIMKPYQKKLAFHKVYRVTAAKDVLTNIPSIQNPI